MKVDTAGYYVDWIFMNFIAERNIYLVLSWKENAVRFYKKTLELYPGYQEARNRLKELEGK